jgi:2-polyprenyl-3-methyl-5-hydroxy-6-metoxy-1,4-benzoquinol methylase
MSWREHGDHPNKRSALQYRHRQLRRAARPFSGTRINVLRRMAQGQKVLDVGCVSHNFGVRGGSPRWLHQHMVDAAAECVGTDYDELGVKEMQAAGYDVVHADITGDISALVARGPFDVIVAGEIIEHLAAPQAFLASCRQLLRPGGKLVVTTPNPFSPRRARAGALGLTWENVDHVVYAFPSGMAELADRTGLRLTRYGTVGWPGRRSGVALMRDSLAKIGAATSKRLRGRRSATSRGRLNLPLPASWMSPLDVLLHQLRGRRGMLGETAIYVLRRPREPRAETA